MEKDPFVIDTSWAVKGGRIRVDTLGTARNNRYTLTAYCDNPECRHRADLDLDRLIERFGAWHSSLAGDLLPKLACSKCKGKRLSLQISPPTGYDVWREK